MKIKKPTFLRPPKRAPIVIEDEDAVKRGPVPITRITMSATPPAVVPSTSAFPTLMAAASEASKEPTPKMEVEFTKPLLTKKEGKKPKVQYFTLKGTLFQWGGVMLVCHRSTYHPNEWMVSEYSTGRFVVQYTKKEVKDTKTAFAFGQRPTDHEARFDAVLFLQRYGMTWIRARLASTPVLNKTTPAMRRYIKEVLFA